MEIEGLSVAIDGEQTRFPESVSGQSPARAAGDVAVTDGMSWPSPDSRDPDVVHVQQISVSYEYRVIFTRGVFAAENSCLVHSLTSLEPGRRHRAFVLIDSGVAEAAPGLCERIEAYFTAHGDRIELVESPLIVTGGEQVKQAPRLVRRLQSRLRARGIDRQSFVVAVGGGAVLDMAGYVAATTHRGVRLVRLPTTVLSQNDSGVGVKNSVNAFGQKNFLGTFAPPFAVINDGDFIETLQPRDRIAGMAEAVKVALIQDRAFFDWLIEHADALRSFDSDATDRMIRRAAQIHMNHIATGGDPFEFGSSRPLDFGHWAAHRLETLSGHRLRHGEAVAIGMALDCCYSVETGELSETDHERACGLMERLGLRLWDPVLAEVDKRGRLAVLSGLDEFREHLGGELTVTLLRAIGRGIEAHKIDEQIVTRCVSWLQRREASRCA